MAKFKCVCGETIRTSGEIPNPQEWLALSDLEFTRLWEKSPEDVAKLSDVTSLATLFYRCRVSGHLWFFWDGMEGAPSLYAPVDSNEMGLQA